MPVSFCRSAGAYFPNVTPDTAWSDPDAALVEWIERQQLDVLQVYATDPLLVDEHGRQEDSYRTDGYANRQVLELAQNAADALSRAGGRGRIEFRLTPHAVYCANEGSPFDLAGLQAISHAHLSGKHGGEIGRFGLGFKSVLGITGRPAIFSRSVSVGFEEHTARDTLRAVAPGATSFPVLRWPMLLDAQAEMAHDETLSELGAWASTVVRLPLNDDRTRLIHDLKEFPREFLLFAEHVDNMVIASTDDSDSFTRSLTCESIAENRWRIQRGSTSDDWLVWHRIHRLSPQALAEMGPAIRRPEVRVSYAVPIGDTSQMGRFWAYFPLQDQTSARGIHNAPWRVNDDRTNMLPGLHNNELLDVLGGLIVEAMPALTSAQDPARHFDYLPARGREAQYEGDKYLTDLIPRLARQVACIPDGTGRLRPPHEMVFLNTDLRLIEQKTFEAWSQRSPSAASTPHPSCYATTTRRARLRSLVRQDERRTEPNEIGSGEWLEKLVPDATDRQCQAALAVLFSVSDEAARREFRTANVLPEQNGRLRGLNSMKSLFIRGDLLTEAAGLSVMRSSFVADHITMKRLELLGFTEVDPSVELRRLLRAAKRKWRAHEWEAFWDLILEVPAKVAGDVLEKHASEGGDIRVRSRSKKWVPPYAVVYPGLVDPTNPDLAVDASYHEDHLPQLRRLGIDIRPVASAATLQDPTYLEFLRIQRTGYLGKFARTVRLDPGMLHVRSGDPLGPLYVLMRFGDTHDAVSQTAWTRELLEINAPTSVEFGQLGNTKKFPPISVQAPHLWAVARYGLLDTCWGPRSVATTLSPHMREYAPLLPVAAYDAATKVTTVNDLSEVPDEVWDEFLTHLPSGGNARDLGQLVVYALTRVKDSPQTLPAVVGNGHGVVHPSELLIAVTEEECGVLLTEERPFLAVEDSASLDALCERFGCQPASSTHRVEYVAENSSEPMVVLDHYGGLRGLASGRLDGWEIVTCSDLFRTITTAEGTRTNRIDIAFTDKAILHTGELAEQDVLSEISREFSLGLDLFGISRILQDAQDQRTRLRIADCRTARDVAAQLLALLPAAALELKLPSSLLDTVRATTGDLGAVQVAELLHHVHGYNVLIELKHLLGDEGFPTPRTWAGSQGAVAFVGRLGFPVEYAGSSSGTLDASLTVLGPPGLNGLHPFQKELRDKIQDLMRTNNPCGRAMLYLPTGAGKTRVTVQALVESIVADEISGPLLWIAQTEELCEQALQTWSTVWRELGTAPLKMYRLWSTNNIAESDDLVCVVVATADKLGAIRDREEYQWLAERTHAVVIDEAHGATAPGITATLRWLGIDGRQTGRPLLGLTATPFKGRSEEANARLSRRFGTNMFNVLGEDPYTTLQDLGVLARVEHHELEGGDFLLDSQELPHFDKFRDVPGTVLDRIGKDETRTRALIEHISISASRLACPGLHRICSFGSGARSSAARTEDRGRDRQRLDAHVRAPPHDRGIPR